MRVNSFGVNATVYQPQYSSTQDKGFADMLVSAHNTNIPESDMNSDRQITAEWDKYLSKEQVEYLTLKYDVNNLGKEEEKAFLDELEKMGVISNKENTNVYARVAMVPPEWMQGGVTSVNKHWTSVGEDKLILSDTPYSKYYSTITDDMSLYDFLRAMYLEESRLYDEGKKAYGEEHVGYMKDLMQTRQKIISIFDQLRIFSESL